MKNTLFGLLALFCFSAEAGVKLNDLVLTQDQQQAWLQMDFQGQGDWDLSYRQDAGKLVIDFSQLSYLTAVDRLKPEPGLVKAVSWVKRPGNKLRLVVEARIKTAFVFVLLDKTLWLILAPQEISLQQIQSQLRAQRILSGKSTAGLKQLALFGSLADSVQNRIKGVSWRKGCPVPLHRLAYLQLPFIDPKGVDRRGELIVHADVAKQVTAIFQQLYLQGFPIEKMQLVADFKASDPASMSANNTSAFNCRANTSDPSRFSKHSYGKAIDINPRWNPYVRKSLVLPKNGKAFVDRSLDLPGMIDKTSICYRLFKRHGWRWGGDWRTLKDYQHFQAR